MSLMEGGGSVLHSILEEDAEDFEMSDVEEGELVGLEGELVALDLKNDPVENGGENIDLANQAADSKQSKRRKKKKKKKPRNKKGRQGSDVINIDRFVLDVCKRLKERKTHMVYTALGYLGVSALSDLMKEVDAIQACGGQKVVNGNRYRSGGGILWNVLKTRDPNAYKEIMKKTREFEKQFRKQNKVQGSVQNKPVSSERVDAELEPTSERFSNSRPIENPLNNSKQEEKRAPVRDRIRIPVSYEDLIEEGQKQTM